MAKIIGSGSLVNGGALPFTEMRAIDLVRVLGIEHDYRPPVQNAYFEIFTDDGHVVFLGFSPDGTGSIQASVRPVNDGEKPPRSDWFEAGD